MWKSFGFLGLSPHRLWYEKKRWYSANNKNKSTGFEPPLSIINYQFPLRLSHPQAQEPQSHPQAHLPFRLSRITFVTARAATTATTIMMTMSQRFIGAPFQILICGALRAQEWRVESGEWRVESGDKDSRAQPFAGIGASVPANRPLQR